MRTAVESDEMLAHDEDAAHNPDDMAKQREWFDRLPMSNTRRKNLQKNFYISRDGYTRWYKGRCVFVCGKTTPVDEVDARWDDKRKQIDLAENEVVEPVDTDNILYRDALGEYLAEQRARVNAERNSIRPRTYHNYKTVLNNFGSTTLNGVTIGRTRLRDIGPSHFNAFIDQKCDKWRSSGFDSVVCLVTSFFRWAIEMEYIDRFRQGPQFVRPGKKVLRSERIELAKCFTVEEVAKLYLAANHSLRCWIALGICAAFNNSDIAHLTRDAIDLKTGVIDFRRRKTGKIRRVIPLPADVTRLLKDYDRPEPTDPKNANLFFISSDGNTFGEIDADGVFEPSSTMSRLFGRLMRNEKLHVKYRNYSGLRTTHYNLMKGSEWDNERSLVMGHSLGTIDLDNYLESVEENKLALYVEHLWAQFRTEIVRLNSERLESHPRPVEVSV